MASDLSDSKVSKPEAPFAASDPSYDFWSDAHCLAAEQLGFAINSAIPLTLFVGEAGVGKTMVARSVVNELAANFLLGKIDDPSPLKDAPCHTILSAFGATPTSETEEALSRALTGSLASAHKEHGCATLLVDNTRQIETGALNDLFDIAGVTNGSAELLFKIILIGHTDLKEELASTFPNLIGPTLRLEKMSDEDAKAYVGHRLACAGYKSRFFSEAALETIVKYTNGNPRVINAVCHAALAECHGKGDDRIGASLVRKCFARARDTLRREGALCGLR